MNRLFAALFLGAGVLLSANAEENRRTIRLIQDDAQDYMVSKVYQLKYFKANDVTPFILGVVKRYNDQSTVNRINYKAANEQLLTVSCPVGMMPYVDEMIEKIDRPGNVAGIAAGDPIRGTGITRAVYPARFRSAQVMVDVMKGIGINGGQDSYVAYDAITNMIYWKDDSNKSNDLFKYLAWLDRPIPMANLAFTIYEVRESELRDLGIDYLGWRNGPGLDLFSAGFDAMSLSAAGSAALQGASGTFGGFFFAPQFDASFIRMLQQDGRASVANGASMTVRNSDTATTTIGFRPQSQAIFKRDNDQLQIGISGTGMSGGIQQPASSAGAANSLLSGKDAPPPLALAVTAPRICFRGPADPKTGLLPDSPEAYRNELEALIVFQYRVRVSNAVERNNYGAELAEVSDVSGECNLLSGDEKILAAWSKENDVEQTIGMPFLSKIPLLKYLFSTTTVNREKSWFFVTARAVPVHPEAGPGVVAGQLVAFDNIEPAAGAVTAN